MVLFKSINNNDQQCGAGYFLSAENPECGQFDRLINVKSVVSTV